MLKEIITSHQKTLKLTMEQVFHPGGILTGNQNIPQ